MGEYTWGNNIPTCSLANITGCLNFQFRPVYNLAPVGSYPLGKSIYGAFDMVGNVWEWVADWYNKDYYAQSPELNPRGPENGEYRVVRKAAQGSLHIGTGIIRNT